MVCSSPVEFFPYCIGKRCEARQGGDQEEGESGDGRLVARIELRRLSSAVMLVHVSPCSISPRSNVLSLLIDILAFALSQTSSAPTGQKISKQQAKVNFRPAVEYTMRKRISSRAGIFADNFLPFVQGVNTQHKARV